MPVRQGEVCVYNMWPEMRHQKLRIESCDRGKTGYFKRSCLLYKVIILTDNSRLLLPFGSFIAIMSPDKPPAHARRAVTSDSC
jgi:hypothetical protein